MNSKNNQPFNPGSDDSDWARISEFLRPEDDAALLYYLYEGLIFPKEDSLMLRCRMTGGELSSEQLIGLAKVAETYGGGYADITTRANFQIRDIPFSKGITVLRALLDLDIAPAVKGINNLRNVTVTPTTGFDSEEITDVIPYAHELINAMLNEPSLQGLPGKFNIALDSGGSISVASEANDLGIKAVLVNDEIYFRISASEMRGDSTIATDLGWLIKPQNLIETISTMLSIFIEKGDFSVRLKSRLKFFLKSYGLENFKEAVSQQIPDLIVSSEDTSTEIHRKPNSHVGIHPQPQENTHYIGVLGATGRFTCEQLFLLSDIAQKHGKGYIRLTTKQTCIIPFIGDADMLEVTSSLKESGMILQEGASSSIVACTGNQGCSYSATDTKFHAKALSEYLAEEIDLSNPVNIHFTGCAFSCAQNKIGDIGLLGTKKSPEDPAYHVFIGGHADFNKEGSKLINALPFSQLKIFIRDLLLLFQKDATPDETFHSFLQRIGTKPIIDLIKT